MGHNAILTFGKTSRMPAPHSPSATMAVVAVLLALAGCVFRAKKNPRKEIAVENSSTVGTFLGQQSCSVSFSVLYGGSTDQLQRKRAAIGLDSRSTSNNIPRQPTFCRRYANLTITFPIKNQLFLITSSTYSHSLSFASRETNCRTLESRHLLFRAQDCEW